MLDVLKAAVKERFATDVIFEAVNGTPDDVKEEFLDLETELEVSEEDKKIEALINKIPEDDEIDLDAMDEEDLESMTEAFIPEL